MNKKHDHNRARLFIIMMLMGIGVSFLWSPSVLAKKEPAPADVAAWIQANATAEWISPGEIRINIPSKDFGDYNVDIFSGTYNVAKACLEDDGTFTDKQNCKISKSKEIGYTKKISRSCSDAEKPDTAMMMGITPGFPLGANAVVADSVNSPNISTNFSIQVGDDCVQVQNIPIRAKTNPAITPEAITQFGKGGSTDSGYADPNDCSDPSNDGKGNCTLVKSVLVPAVNVLGILVGVVVVLSIVVAGIQYITANGNPQQTVSAKNRIFNTILALVVYIFGFALLQWLIPGAVFHP